MNFNTISNFMKKAFYKTILTGSKRGIANFFVGFSFKKNSSGVKNGTPTFKAN